MKRSTLWQSMLGFTLLAVVLLGLNIGLGNTPILGLDLKGGLSVIYKTAEPASGEQLIVVRDLMRGQLEDFGIAEPDVRVEGDNIVVDLPGVSDQEAAFDALQVSGIVSLRPVIQCQAAVLGGDGDAVVATTPTTIEPGPLAPLTPIGTTPNSTIASLPTDPTADSVADDTATTVADDTATTVADDTATTAAGFAGARGAAALPSYRLPSAAPDTTAPSDDAPTTTDGDTPSTTDAPIDSDSVPGTTVPTPTVPVTTVPVSDNGQALLPYPGLSQQCLVGPSGGSGEVFVQGSAKAEIDQTGSWIVTVDLKPEGQPVWNALAQQCFNGGSMCPSRQLAIVLDDEVQSAPVVQTTNFGDSVQISGNFEESEVRALARVLNRGAFPVPVEQQRVETVSATAGRDSLNAAVIAGLIGMGLVLAFMVAYYKKLSVVIVGGLLVWGATVFTLASVVSQATNYALTLAGATGIIVAVGVTVDSYVVYFERLRDEMRHGRSLRNAAPSAFKATWRTIVAADVVSLLASLILFWLSVGSVKGFALYLGLTTISDLLVCFFFTRPAVMLLAETRWFNKPKSSTPMTAGGVTS